MSELILDEIRGMSKKAAGAYAASLRELSGFSQEYVAERIGLSDRQLSRIENGKSTPTLLVLRKLMRELNGSVERFIELLASQKATVADAMRDAATSRSIIDLASQIRSEAELEEVVRVYRSRVGE